MLKVSIKGLSNGTYPVEIVAECTDVENISEEFFGTLHVAGTLRRHEKRYILSLRGEADARLICDVSAEEFVDRIQTDFSLEYIADTHLAVLRSEREDDGAEPPFYIRDDDTSIDLTDEVRQEMAVRLPLKRVAPAYRGKNFSEIFPEYAAHALADNTAQEKQPENQDTEKHVDPRWAALKNISFEN